METVGFVIELICYVTDAKTIIENEISKLKI
jgi:hypothetical protein